MNEVTLYVRKPKAEVLRKLYSVPQTAKEGGPADIILVKALTATSDKVVEAFRVKSRGGTDITGAKWKRLSPYTIAKRLRKVSPTTDRPSSALSSNQRDQWWNYYRRALAWTHKKDAAARIAWAQMRRRGGIGHYDKYGFNTVLILRDTEDLLRSLTPGASLNIFRISPGRGELGSERRGAAAHHAGAKNLPQRRLWPHPQEWTSEWWKEILEEARSGLVQFIAETLHD